MAKTILIVEDEKNIVDILSFNLGREGYATLEAYDGEAGLQLALEQDPDLILLDLMLPKMNGFDVCRSIREHGRATPIIMLTAREEETDKVLGLELGADDYITKPFSISAGWGCSRTRPRSGPLRPAAWSRGVSPLTRNCSWPTRTERPWS